MEISKLVERVQNLSDLELATLLCLIAKQHCCIEVEDELVDDLAHELALVCSEQILSPPADQKQIVSETFGLSYAVLSEDEQGTVEDFSDHILNKSINAGATADGHAAGHNLIVRRQTLASRLDGLLIDVLPAGLWRRFAL